MIEILRNNNFDTPDVHKQDVYVTGKRAKQTERRIRKGFNISTVDNVIKEAFSSTGGSKNKDFFKVIAKAIGNKSSMKDWNSQVSGSSAVDHIGSSRTFAERRMASYRKTVFARGGSQDDLNKLTADELVTLNPKLKDYTPHTRLAYAKFKSLGKLAKLREEKVLPNDKNEDDKISTASFQDEIGSIGSATSTIASKRFERLLKTSSVSDSIKEDDEMVKSPTKPSSVEPEGPKQQKADNLIELSPLKPKDSTLEALAPTVIPAPAPISPKAKKDISDEQPTVSTPKGSAKDMAPISPKPKKDVQAAPSTPKGSGKLMVAPPSEPAVVTPQPSPLPDIPKRRSSQKAKAAAQSPRATKAAKEALADEEYPSGDVEKKKHSPGKVKKEEMSQKKKEVPAGVPKSPKSPKAGEEKQDDDEDKEGGFKEDGLSAVTGKMRSGWL